MKKMTTIKRALNSIGKKCFIDYYEEFKNCNDKDILAYKLLVNNDKATSIEAQITRINYAKWIFANHKEKDALSIIINSNRLDCITKRKARELYNKI